MSEPFDGCWERMAHADTHRTAIAKAWAHYLDEEPYVPHSFVHDDGTGDVSIELVAEIPRVIALELGEYLYQMRAALDGCVYEAACLTTGHRPPPNEHQLEFPITDSREAFDKSARKIQPLKPAQRAVIEALQPFNMPATLTPAETAYSFNRGLAILNDWARKDRHRKLHVAASWVSNVYPMIAIPPGTRVADFTVLRDRFILKDESEIEIATFRIEGWQHGMSMSANPNVMLDLVVDEPPLPCDDKDTLNQRFKCIQYAVGTAIDSVAQTFGIKRFGGSADSE
jgi:hypothetical protein